MDFGGDVTFKGAGCLKFIRKETGSNLISFCFGGEHAGELNLQFDPACFKAIVETAGRFLLTKKAADNPVENKSGAIKPDLFCFVDESRAQIMGRWTRDEVPSLQFSNAKGKVSILFSEAQAGEIEGYCRNLIESDRLRKEFNSTKTI